ncbi:MAG: AMP-binding protein [Pseudonocardiaceae bacterium]
MDHNGALGVNIDVRARRTPDRTALLWPGGSMSYGELLGRAHAVAARLGEVRPGDLVAVMMDKGWEQVAAVIGVSLADAAYLPIDTIQPPAFRGQVLAGAGVREVLTQSWIDQATAWLTQLRVTAVDRLEPLTMTVPGPARGVAKDNLAYVIYHDGFTVEQDTPSRRVTHVASGW